MGTPDRCQAYFFSFLGSAMAFELTCPAAFERHCVNLKLLSYDDSGKQVGVFPDWLAPRGILTFERLGFSLYSEAQVEQLIHRVTVKPTMNPDEEQDALMGDAAVGLRMLHARGMQFVAKSKAADAITAYEWGPAAVARRRVHGW